MKTHFIRLKRTSLLMAALFLFTMTNAQKYYITFSGHGDTNIVQTVTVENLTQKTSLTLPGDQTLILNLDKVGIHEINTQTAQALTIYPNPSNGTSFMQFTLPREGNVDVCLYDMAGKLHKQATLFLQEGVHTLTLPSMATGVYLLSVRSTEYSCFGKWVSTAGGQASDGNIQHSSSAPLTEKETTKTAKAAEADEYTMNYTANDLLRFTGISGNYRTIVMKCPTESQQIDFRFIACTDVCGIHYPVIEIAGIYWMAEDLICGGTTQKPVFRATSAQEWKDNSPIKATKTYRDFGDYDSKYGTHFNYAAALASLPEGWALPTKENFEDLYAAMGREGADIALGLMQEGHDTITLWKDLPASDYRNETGFGVKGAGYIYSTGHHNAKNIGVAYWTSTDDGNGNRYTPYITKDSVQITSSLVTSGMKVRGVVAGDPLKTLQNVFGTLSTKDAKDQKPVGDICVMEDNRKKLFIAIGSSNTNHVRVVEDITAANNSSSTTASTNLPNIPTGTWCKNKIKKAVSQRNAAGRENLVIAVLNVDASKYTEATYGNTEASTTLYIFNDSVNNYAPTTVNLTGALPVAKVNKYGMDISFTQRDFEKINYMHWFYNVKTCDVNGDFVEDFIIVGRHKIAIYDGKAPYDLITWRDFSSDQPLATTNDAFYTCVTTGDVNQDGKDDIVVMTSAPLMNHENATQSPSVLHVFLDGNFTDTSKHKTKLINYYGRYTANVTMGDINGDRKKEVVFSLKHLSGMANVYSITMNANNVFSPVDTLIRHYNAGRLNFMDPINLVYFDGLMAAPYIAIGKSVFQGQGSSWQEVKIGGDSNVLTGNDANRAILADQITVSDYFGDSREHLVYLVQDHVSGSKSIYANRIGKEGSDFRFYENIKIYHNNRDYVDAPTNFEFPTIATVRSNRVARQLQYKRYEYTYSNIQVDAVLAAAPYREGLMTPGSTYWGKSGSSGSQTESQYTTSASAIFGFEQEFTIPVVSQTVGGIDFTTKMSFGYTRGYSNETTITRSTIYTLTGENGVVVSTIPYHSYFYTILKSEDPREVGKELLMAFPDKKVEKIMTIEQYTERTKEDPNAPRLDKVLTHTIGDPESYTRINKASTLSNVKGFPFCYTGSSSQQVEPTGNGTATSDVSITISQDQSESTAMSFDVDIELVVNVGGVKFGGGFGFGSSNKVTKTIGKSTTAGGSVTCPHKDTEGFINFDWNIVFYNYTSNGVIFPVVNFLVNED